MADSGQTEEANALNSITGNEKQWAVYCHLSLILIAFHPALVLLPLVLWLAKRHQYPFVEDQGKEVVNFQITLVIVLTFLSIVLIGILRILGFSVAGLDESFSFWYLLPLRVLYLLIVVVAAWKASSGMRFRYPLFFRLIK